MDTTDRQPVPESILQPEASSNANSQAPTAELAAAQGTARRRGFPTKYFVIAVVLVAAGFAFAMLTSGKRDVSEPGIRMVEVPQPFYPAALRLWKPYAAELAGALAVAMPFLPSQIGPWSGQDSEITAIELKILPADTGLARKFYTNDKGDQVYCTVVLEGKDIASIHRPEFCLQGQGWTLRNAPVLEVPLPGTGGHSVKASQLIGSREVEIPGQKIRVRHEMVFAYWFVSKKRVTHSHYRRVFSTSMDLLLHNRNHRWAYFLLSTNVPQPVEGETFEQVEAKASEVLRQFIADVFPEVSKTDLDD